MNKFSQLLNLSRRSKSTFKLITPSFRLFSTNKLVDDVQVKSTDTSKRIDEGCSKLITETSKITTSIKNLEKHLSIQSSKSDLISASFASLLRHSNFMNLGDPEGKIVIGKVIEVVNNDLYIDFGWKFHCVCPKPMKNHKDFVRGAKVRLRIKDLELSTKFLGATKDVTLLEADCILLGLVWTPCKIDKTKYINTLTIEQYETKAVAY